MTKTLRKETQINGGYERCMMLRMTREAKCRMNRIIHKRRRIKK